MNTYIINLDKDKDRLISIQTQISREKMGNFIRVPGILGKKTIPEDLKKFINYSKLKYQPPGLVGCGLSHINSWKTFYESGKDYALFLEDDAELQIGFREKWKNYSKDIPKDFDVIYLGAFIGSNIDKKYSFDYSMMKMLNLNSVKKVEKISDNIFVPALPLAMHGYILSRKMAKYLLGAFEKDKLNWHIDFQILRYLKNKNSYAVSPSLISQKDIDINTSTNANFSFPKSINKVLTVKDSEGIPMNYKLSLPHFEIHETPINGYTYIFFIFGMLSGIGKEDPLKLIIIFILFFIVDSIITESFFDKNNTKNFLLVLSFGLIGNLAGNLVRFII